MIFDTVATVALSPLLLVQAIRVRKEALRLPEAAGPRSGTVGTGDPLNILIIGDSAAAGVGAQTQSEAFAGQLALSLAPHRNVEWHLVATTGATTASTLETLRSMRLPRADVVVVILGVNDVTRGGPRSHWLRAHNNLRALLRHQTGADALFISEVPPLGAFPLLPNPLRWLLGRRATRFAVGLKAVLAAENDAAYIALPLSLKVEDMAEDGYHPGPVIYAAWAKEMARQILSDRPSN